MGISGSDIWVLVAVNTTDLLLSRCQMDMHNSLVLVCFCRNLDNWVYRYL